MVVLFRYLLFWNCIGAYMKNSWLFLSLRERKVNWKSLPVAFIQLLLRYLTVYDIAYLSVPSLNRIVHL